MTLESQSIAMDCMNVNSDCSYALHSDSNAAHSTHSFLKFPPEIRNKIYKDILGPSRPIHKIAIDRRCPGPVFSPGSCGYRTIPAENRNTKRLDLEIMRTCKQANSEFASMFFAHHTFKFLCSCNLEDFLDHECPPHGFQFLRFVIVKWDGTWRNRAFESLRACHNLERLMLGVDEGTKIRMTDEKFRSYGFRRPNKVTYEMSDGIELLLLLAGLRLLVVRFVGMKRARFADGIWKSVRIVETAEEISDRESVQDLLRSKVVRPKTREERENSKILVHNRLNFRANFNRKLVEEKRAAEKRAAETRAAEKRAAKEKTKESLTKEVKAFHSWMALNLFHVKAVREIIELEDL